MAKKHEVELRTEVFRLGLPLADMETSRCTCLLAHQAQLQVKKGFLFVTKNCRVIIP